MDDRSRAFQAVAARERQREADRASRAVAASRAAAMSLQVAGRALVQAERAQSRLTEKDCGEERQIRVESAVAETRRAHDKVRMSAERATIESRRPDAPAAERYAQRAAQDARRAQESARDASRAVGR
jgi:hypothetical protein